MAERTPDLTGEWKSFYRYPSGRRDAHFWGRHVLRARQDGDRVVFETDVASPSQVTIEVALDGAGKRAVGTWREVTDPQGYYEGREYDGTIEFNITSDGMRLNGTWSGTDRDGNPQSDIWDLVRPDQPYDIEKGAA